jgi:uncharacterized membrane protein
VTHAGSISCNARLQAQDTLRNIFLAACLLFFVVGLIAQAAKLETPALKMLW